jgi:ABC-2 type transport system ATP-binding protein
MQEGIAISTVNLKKPSMDDVFVRYTGKELRDDSPEWSQGASTRAGAR